VGLGATPILRSILAVAAAERSNNRTDPPEVVSYLGVTSKKISA
jgi:hypothetical protein